MLLLLHHLLFKIPTALSSFKLLPSQQSLMLSKDQLTIDDNNYSAYEIASSTRRTEISALSAAVQGDVTGAVTAATTQQQLFVLWAIL